MPTDRHQTVLQFLLFAFVAFVKPRGGKVHFAGIRLRVQPGKFREPDLLLVKDAQDPRRENRFWAGADLTLEVVSEDNPTEVVENRLFLCDLTGRTLHQGMALLGIRTPERL